MVVWLDLPGAVHVAGKTSRQPGRANHVERVRREGGEGAESGSLLQILI